MTLFEAIKNFVNEERDVITIIKSAYIVDNPYIVFDNIYQSNANLTARGKTITDALVKITQKAGIGGDITVTKSNELVFKKLADLLDAYEPFLDFRAFFFEKFVDYHLFFSINLGWSEYGKVFKDEDKDEETEQDIEEMFLESICSARAELEILDRKTSLSRIANFIEYENSLSEYNNAVVVIRKRQRLYTAFARVNSTLGSSYTDIADIRNGFGRGVLQSVLSNLVCKMFENKEIRENSGGYCDQEEEYLNPVELELYDGAQRVLDEFEDEDIILRISQNIEPGSIFYPNRGSVFYPKHFFRVQFKDTSENEIMAESYNRSVKLALFDAVKKMMKKYQISY